MQAQAHVKSGQVFKRESESIKPSGGLSSEEYIVTSMGQRRAQCKPPFSASESRIHFSMGATQSHMARAVDAEERTCNFAHLCVSGISSLKGYQVLLILAVWALSIFIFPFMFLKLDCDRLKLEKSLVL